MKERLKHIEKEIKLLPEAQQDIFLNLMFNGVRTYNIISKIKDNNATIDGCLYAEMLNRHNYMTKEEIKEEADKMNVIDALLNNTK